MPELAAHLERARELSRESRAVYQKAYTGNMKRSVMQRHQDGLEAQAELLAAALAACARETKLEAIKGTIEAFEHEYMNTGEPLSGVARGIRAMCELKFEAERAVEEKA